MGCGHGYSETMVTFWYHDDRYYLEGFFEFMDQETEYHLDTKNNILYSYTPKCVNPNKISSIRGKTQSFALNISSSSYVNITDLILQNQMISHWKIIYFHIMDIQRDY